MSAKGTTTQTPWSAGYIDAWCENGRHRPLRVRHDPEYLRGYEEGDRERKEAEWLRTSFGVRQGTARPANAEARKWNEYKT